jgi:uncharacterized protein
VKLPLREVEGDALLGELAKWDGYVSSALLGVEAIRACGRYGEEYAVVARAFLGDLALLPIDDGVLDAATTLKPAGLRNLDALHLATALSVREEIGVLVTYDRRLAQAAQDSDLPVATPGA